MLVTTIIGAFGMFGMIIMRKFADTAAPKGAVGLAAKWTSRHLMPPRKDGAARGVQPGVLKNLWPGLWARPVLLAEVNYTVLLQIGKGVEAMAFLRGRGYAAMPEICG